MRRCARLCGSTTVLAVVLLLSGHPTPALSRSASGPPTLYLPFAWGASWWANGPHSDSGTSGVRNNVDLGPGGSAPAQVLAAADGIAHVSVCSGGYYVRVDHGGGWMTQYWHLGSVAPNLNGSYVHAGDYLGSTAIVCGNPTSFSHVHFGLFYNGQPYPLDGVSIGGYMIHAGSTQYNGSWTRNSDGATVHVTTNGNANCCIANNQLQPDTGGDGGPSPAFTDGPSAPRPGITVSFDASSSSDPSASITGYAWDFGDGAHGSGETSSHTYGSSGTFTVTLTTSDSNGATASVSHVVSVLGNANAWYLDRATGTLRHAWWTGAVWQFENLDGPGTSGPGRTHDKLRGDVVAATPGGVVNVWYFDAHTNALRHAWWTGSVWQFEKLDGPGSTGAGRTRQPLAGPLAVAVPSSGEPNLWYLDKTTGALRHAWWTGAVWQFETLDGPGSRGVGRTKDPIIGAIAVATPDGRPNLWYLDRATGTLRHAWWTGAVWQFENLDGPGTSGPGRTQDHIGPAVTAMVA